MDHETIFTNLPVLQTGRLYLRRLQKNDAAAVFDYARDPEMTHYTLWVYHKKMEDSEFYVEQMLAGYSAGKPTPWAVTLKETGQVIGTAGFIRWNPVHGRAEIGYAIGRKWWGKGYAAESSRAALAFGFKTLLCNRIEAMCDVSNVASARVMEKIEMRYEGILREYLHAQGSYRDVKIYSILRSEWKGK